MPRAKNRVASRARRKKVLNAAKGYWGKKKNCYTVAVEQVWRSGVYAYRDRKRRKRDFRALWIMRINAGARMCGTTYGKLIHAMDKKSIELNRKSLAFLAANEPDTFKRVVEHVVAA